MTPFRKLSSIILFIVVIIVTQLFSLWILPSRQEGLTTIASPSANDLAKLSEILEGKIPATPPITYQVSTKMKQIIAMRTIALKYTALNDIYNTTTSSYYKALVEAIQTNAKTDAEGKTIDENAMPVKNREVANAIISSNAHTFDKLCNLLELTGKDILMTNISDKYETSWINLIRDFVLAMKNSTPTPQQFKSCSQFTNCTTCTNGKINNTTAQCYWNSEANVCGNSATYGTSSTCK